MLTDVKDVGQFPLVKERQPPDDIFSQCDSNRFVNPPPGLDALFWQRAWLSSQDIGLVTRADQRRGLPARHCLTKR